MPLLPPPPPYAPEFGDVQYNNSARVPDAPAILARWKSDAAAARATLSMRTHRYGVDPAETFDLFSPSDAGGPTPLVVFIHGGYWRSLSKAEFSWVAPAYVARGIAVAVIDYGLAPVYPLETIVRQCLAAVANLWKNAIGHRIRRDAIVVAGHSAGGHLTAMMLAARWPELDPRLPADVLAGGVAISGLYDMEPLLHTPYLNRDLQLTPGRVAPLSPLYMTPATGAPLVTAVGADESDEFLRHDREIGMAWANNLREDVPLPGDNHFAACERFAEAGHRLFEATVELCLRS